MRRGWFSSVRGRFSSDQLRSGREAALAGLIGVVWRGIRRLRPLSGGGEDEHPLDVPGHGHEAPLAARLFQSAHRKLTESGHGFDDAEHRLRGLFAQSVEIAAFRRLQL